MKAILERRILDFGFWILDFRAARDIRARFAAACSFGAMLGVLLIAGGANAAPTTAPATQPAKGSTEAIAKEFAELTDPDPAIREAARINLMGLTRTHLPALRKVVQASSPLAPAQAAVLHDIVAQAYLAGDAYDSTGRDGFMGVRLIEVGLNFRPPAGAPIAASAPIDEGSATTYGVIVFERMPGFCGCRMLQDGDVILSVIERPRVQLRGPTEFSLVIRAIGAGRTMHVEVLRQGQIIRVPITLDPRPEEADFPPAMQNLLDRRKKEMEEYWKQQFAPLLGEGVG
jgi:hypothetical protein